MKFQMEAPSSESGPGGSARYDMHPEGLHATLVDVAADGQSLAQAAEHTKNSGENVSASFGTADVVAAAFNGFWAARDDVGERVSSLLFRKADAVATAASAFVEADSDMASAASEALTQLPATYAPPRAGGPQAVR